MSRDGDLPRLRLVSARGEATPLRTMTPLDDAAPAAPLRLVSNVIELRRVPPPPDLDPDDPPRGAA